jgi:hypothetical protein
MIPGVANRLTRSDPAALYGEVPDGVLLTLDRKSFDDVVIEPHSAAFFRSGSWRLSLAKTVAKKVVFSRVFYALFCPLSNARAPRS